MGWGLVAENEIRAVAGVVLAAGESRRMNCPKLLLPWNDDTVLGCTLANAMAGHVKPLTVICGAEAEAIAAQAAAKGLSWLLNENYALGQSTSLICGLKAVPPGYGVMFILGDMPVVLPASYRELAAAYRESGALIVAPVNSAGQRGNPTVWSPEVFSELEGLSGDNGARELLEQYRQQTLLLPLNDPGLYTDIDTPEDYRRGGKICEC